jgi:hypothetical protein
MPHFRAIHSKCGPDNIRTFSKCSLLNKASF